MSVTPEELKAVLETVLLHHHHVYEVLDSDKQDINDVLDYLIEQEVVTTETPHTLRFVSAVEIEENVSKTYAFFDEPLSVDVDGLEFITEIWETVT